MRLIGGSLLALLMVAGCGRTPAAPKLDQIHARQDRSKLGPIKNWKIADVAWAKHTAEMRDRAYIFCDLEHPNDADCPTEQDYALIIANHAENNVLYVLSDNSEASPHLEAIRSFPAAFTDARRYCFKIYDDGGRADARGFGLCMANAVGGDYFRIVLVG